MEQKLINILQDIEKGEGEFNRDPLIHADNTINAMKALAKEALSLLRDSHQPNPQECEHGRCMDKDCKNLTIFTTVLNVVLSPPKSRSGKKE